MKLATKIKHYFTREKPWRYEKLEREIIGLRTIVNEQRTYVQDYDQLKSDIHEKNLLLAELSNENTKLREDLQWAKYEIYRKDEIIRMLKEKQR